MKITNKAKSKMKKMEYLIPGDTFEFEGECWFVTEMVKEENSFYSRLCVQLQDGRANHFPFEKEVKPVLAEVIIMNDVD